MTITRAQLSKGIRIDDERFTWRDSYHETDSWAFVPAGKKVKCDTCFKEIEEGKLYSIGNRQVYVDAPFYGDWTDKVHAECSDYKSVEEALKNSSPWTFAGFSSLSKEEKIRYLKIAGIDEPTEEMLKSAKALTGMTCVVMGDFSKSRDDIRQEIEREGGVCIDTPNKQHVITHVVLGASGKTQYGGKTGKGSQKYKELMKRKPKPIVVDYDLVKKAIDSGKNIFEEAEAEEETEKQESEEDTEKQVEEKSVKSVKKEETKKEVKKEDSKKGKQEDSEEDKEEAPKKKSSSKKSADEDEEEEEEEKPKKEESKKRKAKEEEKPKKEAPAKKSAKKEEEPEEDDEEEEEEEKPKPKPKRKTTEKSKSEKKQKVEKIDVEKLDGLKRQRLQSLAKKHGIKANSKSEDIIQELKDIAAKQ